MLVVILTLGFLPTLVASFSKALRQGTPAREVPGLTPEETEDFLFLDWLVSEGLTDDGLRRRYQFLAGRIDQTLVTMRKPAHRVADLAPVRCGLCGSVWGATPTCPRCTAHDGSPLPLEYRLML
jgi:hypothetical protein